MSFGDDADLDDGVVSLETRRRKRKARGTGEGAVAGAGGGSGDPPRSIAYPDVSGCPVTPLGKSEGRFVFQTHAGEVMFMSAKQLSTAGELIGLFDGNTTWLKENFQAIDGASGFVAIAAARFLMEACVARGFIRPEDQIRPVGAWRMTDGALLLNLGSRVLIFRERRSQIVVEEFPAGQRYGGHIYPASAEESAPADEPATSHDVKDLYDLFCSWNWERDESPLVLLGFLGCSFIPGALHHRPHIWVSGDTGTGKTTLETLLRSLMGSACVSAGDATKMGIAQKLNGAAKSVWLDEIERDVDGRRQDSIVELARIASTENQQAIVRGSPMGVTRSYYIRACMYCTSIVRAPLKPQDRNRFSLLDLRPLKQDDGREERRDWRARVRAAEDTLGPRLFARVIHSYWRFQANERVVEEVIRDKWSRGGRVVDQLGTLLSMAFALLQDETVAPLSVEAWLDKFAVEDVMGSEEEGEGPSCINHLLTQSVSYDADHGRETRQIAELFRVVWRDYDFYEGKVQHNERHNRLRRHGVAFHVDGGQVGVAVATGNHQGLSELFARTHWAGGLWTSILRRLPGARATKGAVRFAGTQVCATFIPATSIPQLQPVSGDGGDGSGGVESASQ